MRKARLVKILRRCPSQGVSRGPGIVAFGVRGLGSVLRSFPPRGGRGNLRRLRRAIFEFPSRGARGARRAVSLVVNWPTPGTSPTNFCLRTTQGMLTLAPTYRISLRFCDTRRNFITRGYFSAFSVLFLFPVFPVLYPSRAR